MAFDYLLPIDSNNPDYQFIHLDLDLKFGIACKFTFNEDKTKFYITHSKIVYTCKKDNGESENCSLAYRYISPTFLVNSSKYKRQIMINIEQSTERGADDEILNCPENFFEIKKEVETLDPKHLIDINICYPRDFEDHKINPEGISFEMAVRFGSHFCKFYII